jgi:ABC-type sulfate transport system substrate-binding protein
MRAMFHSIFGAIETLFSAVNSFATAFKHIGEWTEAEAGFFADQAKIERQQKIAKLQQQG